MRPIRASKLRAYYENDDEKITKKEFIQFCSRLYNACLERQNFVLDLHGKQFEKIEINVFKSSWMGGEDHIILDRSKILYTEEYYCYNEDYYSERIELLPDDVIDDVNHLIHKYNYFFQKDIDDHSESDTNSYGVDITLRSGVRRIVYFQTLSFENEANSMLKKFVSKLLEKLKYIA